MPHAIDLDVWICHFKSFQTVYETFSMDNYLISYIKKPNNSILKVERYLKREQLVSSFLLSYYKSSLNLFSPQMFRSRNLLPKFLLLK